MISAIVSAYHTGIYLPARIMNLQKIHPRPEIIVVCQEKSPEDYMTRTMRGLKRVLTPDIPTIGKAWNLGIEASTGEYITTANSDDLFNRDGLKIMSSILNNETDMGLVFSPFTCTRDGNYWIWQKIIRRSGEVADIVEILRARCIIGPFPMWRRSIHETVGMFNEDYIVASDYDMWLRMALAGVKFYYYRKPVGIYAWREESLEHRNAELMCLENARLRCELAPTQM
jgi:cellulose synthase/poly-beta-1,6-N-acetylglucosamine synthase-like glycosyltransferase